MTTLPLVNSHGHGGENNREPTAACQSWVHPECTLKEDSKWSVIATTHEKESEMKEEGVKEEKGTTTIASDGGVPILTAMCPLHKKTPTYCSCKKIDDGTDDFVECDSCCDWFHYKCEGVDPDNPPSKFTCRQCRERNGKVPQSERLENSAKMSLYDSELAGRVILKVGYWLGEVHRSLQLPSGGVASARKTEQQQLTTTIKTEPEKEEEGTTTIRHQSTIGISFQTLLNHISKGQYLMKGEQYIQVVGKEGYVSKDDEAIPTFLENRVNSTVSQLEQAKHDIVTWQNDVEDWKNAHFEPYMKLSEQGRNKQVAWNITIKDLEHEIEQLEGFLARSLSLLCLPVGLEHVKRSKNVALWMLKFRNLFINDEDTTGGNDIDNHGLKRMERRPPASELYELTLEGQGLNIGSLSRETIAWRHILNLSTVAKAWSKKAKVILTNLQVNGIVPVRLNAIESHLRSGLVMCVSFPECQKLQVVLESWSQWSERVKVLISERFPPGQSLLHFTRNKILEMKSELQSFLFLATNLLNEINSSDCSIKAPTRDKLIRYIRSVYWVEEAQAALDSAERAGAVRRKRLSDGVGEEDLVDQRPLSTVFNKLFDTSLNLRDEQQQSVDNSKFNGEEEDQQQTTNAAGSGGGSEEGKGILEEVKNAAFGGSVVLLAKELLAKMEITSRRNMTHRPLFPTKESGFSSEPEAVLASLQRQDVHYLEEDIITYFAKLISWEEEAWRAMVEKPSTTTLPTIAQLKGIREAGSVLMRTFMARHIGDGGQHPSAPTFIQEALNDLDERIIATENWVSSTNNLVSRIRGRDKPLCELSNSLHEAINVGKRLRVSVAEHLKQLQCLTVGDGEKEWEMTVHSVLTHQVFRKPLALHSSEARQRLIMLNGLVESGNGVLAPPVLMKVIKFLISSEKKPLPPREKEQAGSVEIYDDDLPVDSLLSYITEGERMVDLDVCDSDSRSAAATFIAASTAVKERLVYLHGRVWSAKATALISPTGNDDTEIRSHVVLLSAVKQHITRFSESFTGLEGFETKRLVLQAEVMKAEKVDSEFAEIIDSACRPPSILATNSNSAEAADISLNEMKGVQELQKNLQNAETVLASVKTASSEAGLLLQTEAEKRASNYIYTLSVCVEAMNLGARTLRLPLDRICEMGGEKLRRALSDDGVIASNYFLLDNALSKAEHISVLASGWRDRVSALLTPKIPDKPSQETAEAISGVILGRSNAMDTEEIQKCSSNTPPKFVTLDMLKSEMDAYTVSLLTANDNFLVNLKTIVERTSQWETAAMDMVGVVSDPRTKLSILTEILEKGEGLPARLPCWSIIHWVYSVSRAHHSLQESKLSYSNRKIPLTIAQDFVSTYVDLVAVAQGSAPEEETEDSLLLLASQAAAEYLMPTAATRSTLHPLRRLCDQSITSLIAFSTNVERAEEEINHVHDLFQGIIETDESTGGFRLTRIKSALRKIDRESLGTTLSNLRDLPDVTINGDLITVLYRALKHVDPYHAELNYAQDSVVNVSEAEGGQRLDQGQPFKPQLKIGDKVDSTKPLAVAQGAAVPNIRQRKLKDPILNQLRVCSKCHIGKKGRMSCRVVHKHWEDPDWPALPNSEKWKPPEGFVEWFEAHSRDSPLFQRGDKPLPASTTQTLSTTPPQQPTTFSQYESVASKIPCVRSDCNAIARAGSVFCSLLCEVRSGEEILNVLLELKCLEATKWMTTNHGHMSESLSQTTIGPETENSVTELLSKLKSTKGEGSLITDRTPFGHVGCDAALNRLSKTAGDGAMKGRRKVLARFESLFLSGMLYMGLVPDPAFCHTLAWNLENELHERFPLKTHAKQYKDKCSSLLFNLQASKNPKLFKDVLLGMDLGKLCKMSATEMAPSDRQREMRRLKEEAVGQHWIRDTDQEDDMIWNSEQGALMHKSQIGRENTTLMASNSDLNPDSMTITARHKSSASFNKRNLVDSMDEESTSVYSPSLKKSRDSNSSDLHQRIDLQGLPTSGQDYSSSLDDVSSQKNVGGGMLGDETNERADKSVSGGGGSFQSSSSKAAPVPVLGFADSQSSTAHRSTGSNTSLVEEKLVPSDEDEGDVISHGFSSSVNKMVEVQDKQENEWGELYPGMVELNPDDAPEGRNVRFLINDPTSKTRFYVRALAKASITSEINPILKHTWEVRGRATGQQALDLLSRSTSEGKKKATFVIIPVEVGIYVSYLIP